jgi:excisionase family DNA binding protein
MPPDTIELARVIAREVGRELAEALRGSLGAPAPGLLPAEELAAALRVSRKTIARMVAQGMPSRRVGGLARYDLEEVKTWLKSRESGAVVDEPAPRRLGRGGR